MADVSTQWTECTCTGTPPAKRYGHSATMQGEHLVVFGGQGGKDQYNDLFVLSTGGGGEYAWSEPAVSGVPPCVRTAHLALAVPKPSPAILVHGGAPPPS